jgi:hypothetical protein
MTLIGSGKNRIMIFGPKDDGTYVVEFRRVASEALGDLDPQKRSQCDPPFPGADAIWDIRSRVETGSD